MSASSPRVLVTLGGIPLFGQERGNIEVFRALQSEGVDALFVTRDDYGHEAIQPALDRLGLRWTEAPYPTRWGRPKGIRTISRYLSEATRTIRAFRRIARSYQPTHIHTMNELYALVLVPVFRVLNVPIVYRVGDEPRRHRAVYRWIWRYLFGRSVSQFVAISAFIRDRLIEAGVPADKIRVIYNSPPERPDQPKGSDLSPEILVPYAGRTVVYLGQISQIKGVDLLVEVALQMCQDRDNVRFLLAGDHTYKNPFADALIARVEAAGLTDRICFLGHVEDVPGLLACADVHVAPSVWEEPLSNVVGEAKQASVPSVVFPSGGLPELAVEQGVDTFVCRDKSIGALAEGLHHYLDMLPYQLAEASQAAKDSLPHLGISLDAFTEAWADVYSSL